MLAKKQRLTKKQFDSYFKSGKRYHSPNLQLIFTKESFFSGAAVVGKKVFKQAVRRNTMRRRLYGVLYRYSSKNQPKGVYIIIAKPTAKNLSRQAMLEEANSLLEEVG